MPNVVALITIINTWSNDEMLDWVNINKILIYQYHKTKKLFLIKFKKKNVLISNIMCS